MPVSPDILRIAASLAHQGGVDQSAGQIARALSGISLAIEVALTPIIGLGGAKALQRRSVQLAGQSHPWLAGAPPRDQELDDTASILRTLLSQQTPADAALGGAAFLQALHDLLGSLVGLSLTERLLRRVWIDFSGPTPMQDAER